MMKISIVAVVGAVCAVCIRKQYSEFAMLISIATGMIILYLGLDMAVDIINTIKQFVGQFDINTEYVYVLLKVTGITFLGEFIISSLKDVGESGIATKVEVFTKLLIVTLAIPIFIDLINTVTGIVI